MRVRFNAINQLFTIILIGLAGKNTGTQSATIRCLIFSIKKNVRFQRQEASTNMEDDDEEMGEEPEEHKNRIDVMDPGFQ